MQMMLNELDRSLNTCGQSDSPYLIEILLQDISEFFDAPVLHACEHSSML